MLEIGQNLGTIGIGFLIWWILAPRSNGKEHGQPWLAYLVTMLVCLEVSSEMMMSRPNAFFFTVGGSIALFFVLLMRLLKSVVYIERK